MVCHYHILYVYILFKFNLMYRLITFPKNKWLRLFSRNFLKMPHLAVQMSLSVIAQRFLYSWMSKMVKCATVAVTVAYVFHSNSKWTPIFDSKCHLIVYLPFEPHCKISAEEKTIFNVILILPHILYIPKTLNFLKIIDTLPNIST